MQSKMNRGEGAAIVGKLPISSKQTSCATDDDSGSNRETAGAREGNKWLGSSTDMTGW